MLFCVNLTDRVTGEKKQTNTCYKKNKKAYPLTKYI